MKTMKTNKILVGLATFLFAMAFVFSSCDRDTAVTGVELDKSQQSVNLVIGERDTLIARVIPGDATNRNVTWYSDNTAVVTVTDGIVYAVAVGNARVTVTTQDGNYQDHVNFVVADHRIPVDGVTIDSVTRTGTTERIEFVMDEDIKTISILHGNFITFHQTVSPEDTEDGAVARGVTWTSRNPGYVEIGATTGAVTFTAPGTTYVVVTTTEGGFQDSVRVTVEPIRVENVEIQLGGNAVTEHEMRIHHVRTFTAILNPVPSFPSVAWTIEHISGTEGEVVTMENGVVTGVGEGRVYLIATATENGLGDRSARVEITVSGIAVSGVTLDETELQLTVPSTFPLVATVAPADASDQTVEWVSSNPSIATVTANGVVGAVGLGTATITARTTDGGFEATATVTVIEGPPAVCIEDHLDGLITPETVRFLTPELFVTGNLTWSDVVVADACDKTTYYAANPAAAGITQGYFMSDCRTASPLHGGVGEGISFFSWCAVMMHREVLCPAPWRVPTREDFQALDRHFGGDGVTQRMGSDEVHANLVQRFQTEWGARRVGSITSGTAAIPEEGVVANGFGHRFFPFETAPFPIHYWQFGPERQTTGNAAVQANNRFVFEIVSGMAGPSARGEVRPFVGTNANSALQLRCVRDNN